MIRTRLKYHKSQFPHIVVVQDKFLDVKAGHYVVSIELRCRKCGERENMDFRDTDDYPIARAHGWLGKRLAEHGHREQYALALRAASV